MAEEGTTTQDGNTSGGGNDEISMFRSQIGELSGKVKKYETDLAHHQKTIETLTEEKTRLLKERGDKGGSKEREEYETHLKGEYDKRYGAKLTEYEEKNKAQTERLNHLEVVVPAMEAATGMFTKESMKYVKRDITDNCFYDEASKEIRVKGPDGNPRPSIEDPRRLMGIDEFLRILAKENPMFVPPQQVNGTHQNGTNAGSPVGNGSVIPAGFENLSRPERVAALAKDPKLREQWGKV